MTTTSTSKKLTKRDHFNTLLTIPEVASNQVLVDFINNELDLLSRKNSADKKPTATQMLNEKLQNAIVAYMKPGERYTVSQFIKEVPECAGESNQKISAMMILLKDAGKVEKVIEKRVSYFQIVEG